ncbi:MAG: lysine-sensitive aspartokinase 3 [Spirochaetales bacterium]|nr:lysine-sensitive aspartokinase 3 [Spirochaetales bacterium]
MVILKFGGTSVRDAEWINKALEIVKSQLDRAPVMIVSAMGKTTDKLQEIAHLAEKGMREKADNIFQDLKEAHFSVIHSFLTNENLSSCLAAMDILFIELKSIIKGLSYLRECTPRSNDAILSFGELFSTTIIAHRAREIKIDTAFIDSREIIKTDDQFTHAVVDENVTHSCIRGKIKPQKGKLTVAQGFIASTKEGITTTLGRGGSDYTASIIGAACHAEEIQIWTDVDGIMSSDPRIIPKAKTVAEISYKEAAELAYFGARVIHPSTIQPAINLGIPVLVKNTGNPQSMGTRIIANGEGKDRSIGLLKAIAFKKGITIINITSYRMLLAYGFLRMIFDIFEKYKTSVDLVSTSEVSVSMTIDNTSQLESIEKDLKAAGNVSVENNLSIICLVGQGLWRDPQILSKVYGALDSIPIRMISLGASDTNLSFVVPDNEAENTIKCLHKVFFE